MGGTSLAAARRMGLVRRGISSVLVILALLVSRTSMAYGDEGRFVNGGPNRFLVTTGATTFAFAYLTAAYVGAVSDRASDRMLLIPIAGPWVTLAARSSCDATGGCEAETTYKTLAVVDGIVQLAGVAQIAAAYVVGERVPVSVAFSTMAVRGGIGATASGVF